MFFQKYFFIVSALLSVCFFSACVKYHNLLVSETPQGSVREDKREIAYNNVRSMSLYDEFATVAIFDALALSGEVRSAYVDLYSDRRGLSQEARDDMINKQLDENANHAAFYVLADIRDRSGTLMNEKNPFWTMYLKLQDGRSVEADSIKEVELEPEIQMFFGKKFNPFKTSYLVEFPADVAGSTMHISQMDKYSLVIGSPYRKCELVWETKDRKERSKVKKNEDLYWS